MIFFFGPLYSGKRELAKELLGWDDAALEKNCRWDVQDLAAQETDLEGLADRLAAFPAVIATDVGSGVVPLDREERENREKAGRLSCLLSQRADTVVRVFCGLPQVLKGELP